MVAGEIEMNIVIENTIEEEMIIPTIITTMIQGITNNHPREEANIMTEFKAHHHSIAMDHNHQGLMLVMM